MTGFLYPPAKVSQALSNHPLLAKARKVNMACPPSNPHAIPERFSRYATSVLHAASTTPEPIG